jgi:hypothetical protein
MSRYGQRTRVGQAVSTFGSAPKANTFSVDYLVLVAVVLVVHTTQLLVMQ